MHNKIYTFQLTGTGIMVYNADKPENEVLEDMEKDADLWQYVDTSTVRILAVEEEVDGISIHPQEEY